MGGHPYATSSVRRREDAADSAMEEEEKKECLEKGYGYQEGDLESFETGEGLDVKFKLRVLADLLKCPLCDGFLRNAVTIRECLHTFCRSCLYRYMFDGGQICPLAQCSEKLGATGGDEGIEFDRAIQNLVDKMFPHYHKRELEEMSQVFSFCGMEEEKNQLLNGGTVMSAAGGFLSSSNLFPSFILLQTSPFKTLGQVQQNENHESDPQGVATIGEEQQREGGGGKRKQPGEDQPEDTKDDLQPKVERRDSTLSTTEVVSFHNSSSCVNIFTSDRPPAFTQGTTPIDGFYPASSTDRPCIKSALSSSASRPSSSPSEEIIISTWQLAVGYAVPPSSLTPKPLTLVLLPWDRGVKQLKRPYLKTTANLQVKHLLQHLSKSLGWAVDTPPLELLLEGLVVARTHSLEFVCRSKRLNLNMCILFRYRKPNDTS